MSDDWPWPKVPGEEQRAIRFRPAFHRCAPNPNKNYGIGGVRMVWILRVGSAAISWETFTDWGLPDEAFKAAVPDCTHPMHQDGYPRMPNGAMGGAVDWHLPPAEGAAGGECPVVGGRCEGDVWFGGGDVLFDLLRTEGDEAVWTRMRELLDERSSMLRRRVWQPYSPKEGAGIVTDSKGASE